MVPVYAYRTLRGAPECDAAFRNTLAPKWDADKNDGELVDVPAGSAAMRKRAAARMKTACFGHSKHAIEHCVSKFLAHVRRLVVEFVVGRVLSRDGHGAAETASTDRLDEPTAYYLLHRHDFGLEKAPVGARILYAMACGLSD